MGTTSNYSWPYPESTGLVKDGWEDIKDLATAIDTTAASTFTGGLQYIKQVSTGGAVSSVDIDDCFSATYNAYRIIVDVDFSTSANINFRLRVGGSTNSSTIYDRQILEVNGTALAGIRQINQTSWNVYTQLSGKVNANALEIYNPFETVNTTGLVFSTAGTGGSVIAYSTQIITNVTTSFTGFTLLASAGTINGTVSVLGYKK